MTSVAFHLIALLACGEWLTSSAAQIPESLEKCSSKGIALSHDTQALPQPRTALRSEDNAMGHKTSADQIDGADFTSLLQVEFMHSSRRKKETPELWASLPNSTVAISYMFCCEEHEHVQHLLQTISTLKFCFNEILVIIDTPHDEPGGYDKFFTLESARHLLEEAQNATQAAVMLLEQHCQGLVPPATASVKVLDYDATETLEAVLTDYGSENRSDQLSLRSYHEQHPSKFLFDEMYKNTMAYDATLRHAHSDFILHLDSDFRILEYPGESIVDDTKRGDSIIETMSRVMQADQSITSISPACRVTNRIEDIVNSPVMDIAGLPPREIVDVQDADFPSCASDDLKNMFSIKYKISGREQEVFTMFNTQAFFVNRTRMKGLYPVRLWKEPVEDIWNEASASQPTVVQHLRYCTRLNVHGVARPRIVR